MASMPESYSKAILLMLQNELTMGKLLAGTLEPDWRLAVRVTNPPKFEAQVRQPHIPFDRFRTSTREAAILIICAAIMLAAYMVGIR